MKVIKTGRVENRRFRLIRKSYAIEPHENSFNEYIEWDEYKVQIKILWFWVTIKTFATANIDDLNCDIFETIPISRIEAEELYDAIVNPYINI